MLSVIKNMLSVSFLKAFLVLMIEYVVSYSWSEHVLWMPPLHIPRNELQALKSIFSRNLHTKILEKCNLLHKCFRRAISYFIAYASLINRNTIKSTDIAFTGGYWVFFPRNVCSLNDLWLKWPFAASHSMHFINRSTWKSSQHCIITTVMALSMRVILTSITFLRLCFIKIIVLAPSSACFPITSKYLSSSSFIFLYVPCCCHVCLRRVWSRGGGDRPNLSPKSYESNFFPHYFEEFGKQHPRYGAILSSIILSQQCREVYFSSTVLNP